NVGAPLLHRVLDLFDEQPLPADVGKWLLENLVALRGDAAQRYLALRIQREEAIANVLRVAKRQRGFAQRDLQLFRRRRHSRRSAWQETADSSSQESVGPTFAYATGERIGRSSRREPEGIRDV